MRITSIIRHVARVLGRTALCAGMLSLLTSASPPIKVAKPQKAWVRGDPLCAFRLSSNTPPKSADGLIASVLDAWKGALQLPADGKIVQIEGGKFPRVDLFKVDLSQSHVDLDHKMPSLRVAQKAPVMLEARKFEYLADPMLLGSGKVRWSITASQVRLDLQHDKRGNPFLLVADAKDGVLQFDATRKDLERAAIATARAKAKGNNISIDKAELYLQAIGPRSLRAKLHLVTTTIGIIPAGLRFTARVDIDDQLNGKISELTCDGDEALGPLVVGFIRPALEKVNGQTKPLLSFPSEQLKLRDVQIKMDESIHVTAAFGR